MNLSLRRRDPRSYRVARTALVLVLLGLAVTPAPAQNTVSPVPAAPAAAGTPSVPPNSTPAVPPSSASTLESLGWLQGCWDGKVNMRDFREEWLPLRGEMMVGVSHTVMQGKTQDFEYLRLESRPEGVFYVAVPSGKKETSFRFVGRTEDGAREVFSFENLVDEFPQRLIYTRGTEGWLYATVEGKLNGQARNVIYPMRRVDCASGEFIRK